MLSRVRPEVHPALQPVICLCVRALSTVLWEVMTDLEWQDLRPEIDLPQLALFSLFYAIVCVTLLKLPDSICIF